MRDRTLKLCLFSKVGEEKRFSSVRRRFGDETAGRPLLACLPAKYADSAAPKIPFPQV